MDFICGFMSLSARFYFLKHAVGLLRSLVSSNRHNVIGETDGGRSIFLVSRRTTTEEWKKRWLKVTCCGGREYTLWAPLEDKLVATLYETNINMNEEYKKSSSLLVKIRCVNWLANKCHLFFLAFSSKPKTVMIFQLPLDGTPFMVQN